MELLCPTCQQKLVIPDESAGQPAKCPQCGTIFPAPTLSGMPAAFASATAGPTPAPTATMSPPAPALAQPPAHGGSGDGAAAATVPPPRTPTEMPPDFDAPAAAYTPPVPASPPPTAPAPSGEYAHKWTIWISPRALQGIAVLAVVAVFVLTFFSWVGLYPGGVGVTTQSGWQAAFGAESVEKDVTPPGMVVTVVKEATSPGASGLLIVYLLLLIPTVVLTVAAEAWGPWVPAALTRFKAWRWALAGGVGLLAFVFLVVQLFTGFPLENKIATTVDQSLAAQQTAATTPALQRDLAMARGLHLDMVRRTALLCWLAWLHLLAVVCALAVFRLERKPGRPLPRIELQW